MSQYVSSQILVILCLTINEGFIAVCQTIVTIETNTVKSIFN